MPSYNDQKIEDAKKRIPNMEHVLGSNLNQPFSNLNSGARKQMAIVHRTHVLPIIHPEPPIIRGGYENKFGDESSSIITADTDYQVIAKISKFSFSPNHHYWLIIRDIHNKKLDIIERRSYEYRTESYGYLYNNMYMDSLDIQSYIPKDTVIRKSLAYDEVNNRADGRNLDAIYLALDQNMEDSIIISESVAKAYSATKINPVSIMLNENYIPLNIYGNDDVYKCIPDIGEDIKNSILIAYRKEKKEEMIYSESVEHLKTVMMSDEKKTLTGKVIDITLYCNNPENLAANKYNSQFLMYYNETIRVAQEFITAVMPYVAENYELSFELEKHFAKSKRVLNKDKFTDQKPFSNVLLDIVVLEEFPIQEGDKIANRFGGKGIVSKILPDDQMPRDAKTKKPVDIIYNSCTVVGRENCGQLTEQEINHYGDGINSEIKTGRFSLDEAWNEVIKFTHITVPDQAEVLTEYNKLASVEQRRFLLESMLSNGYLSLSSRPISDSFDIFRLMELRETFPYIEMNKIEVPMKDSNGNIRFVEARRPVLIGKEYIYRLKQYAEEKFSATSLSSTNLRGENAKSKQRKNHNMLYSDTPIRLGNMEINVLAHMGPEYVEELLMLHSLSTEGRKRAEGLYYGDPYNIDIKLDMTARNRAAEINAVYLKCIGRRLIFKKTRKHRYKEPIVPIYFDKDPVKPVLFFRKDADFDPVKLPEEMQAFRDKVDNDPNVIRPIQWGAIDIKRREWQLRENKLALEQIRENKLRFNKDKDDNQE